jgi:CheY-like chemotaxis protein
VCTSRASTRADVRTADGAAAALESFRTWTPDVLVSDIGMPDEDGYSFIGTVRALSAGFQMHIAKPIEPAELIAPLASGRARGRTGKRDVVPRRPELEINRGTRPTSRGLRTNRSFGTEDVALQASRKRCLQPRLRAAFGLVVHSRPVRMDANRR